MAPSKPAKTGSDGLTVWFVVSCLACLLIGAIVGSQGVMYRERTKPVPEMTDMERHEQVAAAMIRMGFVQWVAACGHETAKKGGTRREAMNRCSIDFGLGEPRTGVVEAEDRR